MPPVWACSAHSPVSASRIAPPTMAAGIEAPPQEQEIAEETFSQQSVTFVLEGATLEVAKVGKGYEILNCDEHVSFLKRHNRDPAAYRPDICHQV